MRTIEWTGRFKRDYRREKRGRHGATLDAELTAVLTLLQTDQPLPDKLRDHALNNEWKDCRDCHIRPDLVRIYSKPDDETLQLIRLGSHSELSL